MGGILYVGYGGMCVLLDHGHTYACNVCNVLYIYLNLDT